jgi:hypothetical protein
MTCNPCGVRLLTRARNLRRLRRLRCNKKSAIRLASRPYFALSRKRWGQAPEQDCEECCFDMAGTAPDTQE